MSGQSGCNSVSFNYPKLFVSVLLEILLMSLTPNRLEGQQAHLHNRGKPRRPGWKFRMSTTHDSFDKYSSTSAKRDFISGWSKFMCRLTYIKTHAQCHQTVSSAEEIVVAPLLTFYQLCIPVCTQKRWEHLCTALRWIWGLAAACLSHCGEWMCLLGMPCFMLSLASFSPWMAHSGRDLSRPSIKPKLGNSRDIAFLSFLTLKLFHS